MRTEQELLERLEMLEGMLESDLIENDSKHDLEVMANTIRWALGLIDDDGEDILKLEAMS